MAFKEEQCNLPYTAILFSTSISKDQRVVFKIFNTLALVRQNRLKTPSLPGANPLVGGLRKGVGELESQKPEWSARAWGSSLLPVGMEVC